MRNLLDPAIDRYRLRDREVMEHYGTFGDETCGAFQIPHNSNYFICVAAQGGGWDHVSISLKNRCPSWAEMDHLKRLFFKPDETAMQLHVPPAQHINCHPFALHLWRPQQGEIPLPPPGFV